MIITFVDSGGNSIHSCTDCEDLHGELEIGKSFKIKGTEYKISKIETNINGKISRIVHLI